MKNAQILRQARSIRTRKKLAKAGVLPRLHVFRSNRHMYVQIINDESGKTIAAASEKELKFKTKTTKTARALAIGKLIAKKALQKKTTQVKFDRGAYKYHGRIKAVAEGAREAGLKV